MSASTPQKKFQPAPPPENFHPLPDWEGILVNKRFWGCLRASILLILYKNGASPQIDYKDINSISKVWK